MSQCPADRAPEPPPPPPPSCGAAPPRITENVNKKHVAAPPWIRHIEGGTLVEGIAEGFRHPTPDYPDPIAELLKIRELGWENLLHDFMSQTYPEGEYSPDERERLRDAFRKRFVEDSRDGHAQFRREIAELQATSPDVAKQLEAQLPLNMASDETSGVMMAYYMMAILRMGGVLASRRELQDRGVLELDCPVCLGQLDGRKGLVTFHVLECGHRIHQECLFQIAGTPDAAGGVVRRCPVCRSASRTRHSFVVKGAMV